MVIPKEELSSYIYSTQQVYYIIMLGDYFVPPDLIKPALQQFIPSWLKEQVKEEKTNDKVGIFENTLT